MPEQPSGWEPIGTRWGVIHSGYYDARRHRSGEGLAALLAEEPTELVAEPAGPLRIEPSRPQPPSLEPPPLPPPIA